MLERYFQRLGEKVIRAAKSNGTVPLPIRAQNLSDFSSLTGGITPPESGADPSLIVEVLKLFFGTNLIDWAFQYQMLFSIIDKMHMNAMEMAFSNADVVGLSSSWDVKNPMVQYTSDMLAQRISAINNTTKSDITRTVLKSLDQGETMPELSDRLSGLFHESYRGRSLTIARTESQVAYNMGSKLAYEQDGIRYAELADNPAHDTDYGASDGLSCAKRNGLIVRLENVEHHVMAEHPNGTLAVLPVLDPTIAEDFYDTLPVPVRIAVDNAEDRARVLKDLRRIARKGTPPWLKSDFDVNSLIKGGIPPSTSFSTTDIEHILADLDLPINTKVIKSSAVPYNGLFHDGQITLNAAHFKSSDDVVKTVYHEYGHALHAQSAPLAYASGKGVTVPTRISARVSMYATTNDREFVAEVYGRARAYGTTFDDEVMDWYRRLDGPEIGTNLLIEDDLTAARAFELGITKESVLDDWNHLVADKSINGLWSKKKGEKWAVKAKAVGLIDAKETKYIKDEFAGSTEDLFSYIDNLVMETKKDVLPIIEEVKAPQSPKVAAFLNKWEKEGQFNLGASKKVAGKWAVQAKEAGILSQTEVNEIKDSFSGTTAVHKLKLKIANYKGGIVEGFKIPPPPESVVVDKELFSSLKTPSEFLTEWTKSSVSMSKEELEAFAYEGWQKGILNEGNYLYVKNSTKTLPQLKSSFGMKFVEKIQVQMNKLDQLSKKEKLKDQLEKLKVNLNELKQGEVTRPVAQGSYPLPGFYAEPFIVDESQYQIATRLEKLKTVKANQPGTNPMSQLMGGISSLTEEERSALRSYTGNGYNSMNGFARGKGTSRAGKSKVDILDRVFLKPETATPVDLFARRGISWGSNTAFIYSHLTPGDIISDSGFISTSVAVGWNWGSSAGWQGLKSIQLEILIPEGSHVLGAQHLSMHSNEQEVLLPRGSSFLVLAVEETDSTVRIFVELIGGKP